MLSITHCLFHFQEFGPPYPMMSPVKLSSICFCFRAVCIDVCTFIIVFIFYCVSLVFGDPLNSDLVRFLGMHQGPRCLLLPCRRSRRVLFLTRFFLSFNTSFSHTSRHSILTKLGHSDRYLDHYSCVNNDGVRDQDGVTGVKKVIFTKKASSPTEYLASMRDLCICISLTPSTKVMILKIHPGSFGVTGVKRSFSPKRHQVLQNT